jgi:mannose-1-phosphate guanylyltransferase
MGGFVAVIPAGGVGSRLWPLSTVEKPKFLHSLGPGPSLLWDTVERLRPLADSVTVITNERYRDRLGVSDVLEVFEPFGRDSLGAIGLGAALAELQGADVVGFFPADHVVENPVAFWDAVNEAVELAGDGHLVTLGVRPTFPATGFGYIGALGDKVSHFVEKPDVEKAERLMGWGYLWNVGVFVAQPCALLDMIERHTGLRDQFLALAGSVLDSGGLNPDAWADIPRVAFDYAVAEPVASEGLMRVVKSSFGWDDVGDWAAVKRLDDEKVAKMGAGRLLNVNSTGVVVSDRDVCLLDVDDVVVVDVDGVLLVTRLGSAQQVREVAGWLDDKVADFS